MTLNALAHADRPTLAAALAAADAIEQEVAAGRSRAEAEAAFRAEAFGPFVHLVGERAPSMSHSAAVSAALTIPEIA